MQYATENGLPLHALFSGEPSKKWFLAPRFVGGGVIPDFGNAFSNYTSDHVADFR